MYIFHYIFWISISIIFYNYIGYGLLLLILTGAKNIFINAKNLRLRDGELEDVTLVIAAYNEEAVIAEKISNCLDLNYPPNKISFLFITDGSTDKTAEIISEYPQIQLLNSPERKGKTAALNRAMEYVTTPITVFCDANAMLNRSAILRIVSHYRSKETGGVAGEKRVMRRAASGSVGAGEGLYWKYESYLKRLDSELYTVAGAAGELFSIRTKLWVPLPENVVLDDFLISIRVNLKGYRVGYEPAAYALELPSASLKEEKKRKIRISAGAFQIMSMKEIWKIRKHPILFFQFFSHRFLRWTLTPICLPLLLLANIPLAVTGSPFFRISLIGQIMFYVLAISGSHVKTKTGKLKTFKILHYILFMNYSVYLGFFRFMKGKQSGVWEKAKRQLASET